MSGLDLLEAALRYLPRTIPLVPRDKRPLVTDWPNWPATRDSIEAAWRGHPQANVGIRTGDRLVVIDIDPRAGGADSLAELEANHGALPATLTALTGGADSGTHRYFRAPAGALASRTIAPGLELKADGRQVVAPPSIHPDSGRAYRWAGDRFDSRAIVGLPAWLRELAGQTRRPPTAAARTSELGDDDARAAADVLLTIPAAEYVPALTGRPVDGDGYVRCPFHRGGEERTASLHVLGPRPTLWRCFGCGQGGDVYVLAGLLLGIGPPLRGIQWLFVSEQVARFYEQRWGIEPGWAT